MRYYIGLATTFHDPAIAIVAPDGDVLFAEAVERPLQYKRAPGVAADAGAWLPALLKAHIPAGSEVILATSWGEAFTRLLEDSSRSGAFAFDQLLPLSGDLNRSMVPERTERGFVAELHAAQARAGVAAVVALDRAFGRANIAGLRRYGHHLSHAAYACFGSPFDAATCLVVDGMGETGASAIYACDGPRLREVKKHRGRESIGFFFGFVTDLAGFDQTKGEEWKIMGLAPYGRRDEGLLGLLRRLYRVERGKLVFASEREVRAVAAELLARRPERARDDGWADLCRCGQDVFEEMMDVLLADAAGAAPHENLVLSGGCALNSSYNGKVLDRGLGFRRLHVPSAPADDGNAIGAAWLAFAEDRPGARPRGAPGRALSPYLGSRVCAEPVARMAAWDPRARRLGHDGVIERAADLLAEGKLLGFVQGRAEFGPRALGNRSILADPRPANAKEILNAKVKYREAFRPFAPSILAERGPEWFEHYQDSPYMERTLRWREEKRPLVPAVVHEDGTGRLQSVTSERNPRYRALLEAFDRRTGVPILLNTSFNVMGKPILHTAEDALLMFATTGLDAVVIEDWIVEK